MTMPTKPFSVSSFIGQMRPHKSTDMKATFILGKWLIAICLSCISCQSKTTTFDSFDSQRWISEATDCKGYRKQVIVEMEKEFEKFIGMSETELIKHLGHPEKTMLYTRGQKFFSYEIDCLNNSIRTSQLRIRFSALDYVNEVLILD